MVKFQLNALSRRNGDSFSRTVEVQTHDELLSQWDEFKKEVPFDKWYADNEMIDGTPREDRWLEDLE